MKQDKKLQSFEFNLVNLRSDKAFKAVIKAKDYESAEKKLKEKFPYPLYKQEHE